MISKFIYVGVLSVVSMSVMLMLSKLIGNRQSSELSLFDHVNSITIGSIAAELATSDNLYDSIRFLIATVIYGVSTFLFAYVTNKHTRLRSFFEGRPIVLMREGKIDKEAFSKARLDVNEFSAQCRLLGFFDIFQIDTAVIEPSGKLSVIPKSFCKPLTVGDAGTFSKQEKIAPIIVQDGAVVSENLEFIGKDGEWLKGELSASGTRVENVFLAVYSGDELKILPNMSLPQREKPHL